MTPPQFAIGDVIELMGSGKEVRVEQIFAVGKAIKLHVNSGSVYVCDSDQMPPMFKAVIRQGLRRWSR